MAPRLFWIIYYGFSKATPIGSWSLPCTAIEPSPQEIRQEMRELVEVPG
jgi:hypothetical protein